MKRLALLLAAAFLTSTAVSAATTTTEPLLLEPLSPTVLSTTPAAQSVSSNGVEVTVPGQEGVYNASYTTQLDENMVPQNAAAEGKPVPEKKLPRTRVQTKQRSQGNAYWNAGGKGTKSFF